MNPKSSKDKWTLAVTILVLLLPFFVGGVYIYQKHQWALNRLNELEPRFARLEGILTAQESLEQAKQDADVMLATYLYPEDKVLNQVGNEIQQQVRDILSAAGLRVGSSQVLPLRVDSINVNLDRIQLAIRAEGELVTLQAALIGLKSMRPAIFVDGLSINTAGTPRAEVVQKLTIQLELSAWRAHP